jgi:sugar lactone lactonase YvrE
MALSKANVTVPPPAPGTTSPGVITTLATTGGFGTPANAAVATFLEARGIAIDAAGNLYISETGLHRIHKVTPDGIISTLATSPNPTHIAFDGGGNLYVADSNSSRVRRIAPNGDVTLIAGSLSRSYGFSGDGGPATEAQLFAPTGLALDTGGNLYIADTNNNRVRKVDPDGVISTFAGRTPTSSRMFTGDGGPATAAGLYSPGDVAVDSAVTVYIW